MVSKGLSLISQLPLHTLHVLMLLNTMSALISGSDFSASVNKAVTFRPSEEMKMVMVPIRQDEVFEGEEVFTARLSVGPDSNGVVIGRQGTATTSIIDGTITVADRDSVVCTMGLGPL